jgi:hypothetical protein
MQKCISYLLQRHIKVLPFTSEDEDIHIYHIMEDNKPWDRNGAIDEISTRNTTACSNIQHNILEVLSKLHAAA